MKEKKIIRGLCGLVKDYFRDITSNIPCQEKMFEVWEDCLQKHFPDLYTKSRLMILGHISVECLGWKYTQKVNSFKQYSQSERKKIIAYGKEFRQQRNKLGTAKDRKKMITCPIVKLGRLLFCSSEKYESAFWRHIQDHKKADINNLADFKKVHVECMSKVPIITCRGDIYQDLP